MRYDQNDEESQNVEDRRGQGGGGFRFPGFPRGGGDGRRMRIPIPMGRGGRGGGIGIVGLLIIGGIMLMLGINPFKVLMGGGAGGLPDLSNVPRMPQFDRTERPSRSPFDIPGLPGGSQRADSGAGDDQLASFTKKVLRDTEQVWGKVFQSFGRRYEDPTLVLFTNYTSTACGAGQSAMGPFYCPLDRKIYVDLGFYRELRQKFQAPGDFAQAYVIAHEVGHHVQTLLGIANKVQQMKQNYPSSANQIQVRMELQADCLAGVWANLNDQLNKRLEPGDIQEGLNAASQIGDDMIQRRTTGRVVPDAFTHGSSAQRVRWFRRGYDSGKMQACDTFSQREL